MDARTIAERLGLPEDVVRAAQRHGVLLRLDLDDAEIRELLWRAHLRASRAAERHSHPERGLAQETSRSTPRRPS